MEATTENLILKELHELKAELYEFREENNKRWEQNDKKLDKMDERISTLEEGRNILMLIETMQKSIDSQFREMREHMDTKIDKLFMTKRENEIEHEEFKKLLYVHDRRIDFQSARLKFLEEWKAQIDFEGYTTV